MIRTKSIISFLETIFNKDINSFTENDFESIEKISIDPSLVDEPELFLEDLFSFPNLKQLNISNCIIKPEYLKFIEMWKIDSLKFKNCQFDDSCKLDTLKETKEIELIKCSLQDYSFLDSMKELQKIVVFKPKEAKKIVFKQKYADLKILILNDCEIEGLDVLKDSPIELLNVIGSSLQDSYKDDILGMNELKTLYISVEKDDTLFHEKTEVYNDTTHLAFEPRVL